MHPIELTDKERENLYLAWGLAAIFVVFLFILWPLNVWLLDSVLHFPHVSITLLPSLPFGLQDQSPK